MLVHLIFCAALLLAPARGEEPAAPVDAPPDAVTVAEYRRLSDQLDTFFEKQIWVGAERTYLQMQALGVELGFDDHLAGAHSARHLGEIGLAHERLSQAARLRPDRAVVDWLWSIDQEYGRVVLVIDPPGEIALRAAAPPFAPDARRCIEVAGQHLTEELRFEGMLPVGTYTLGAQQFTVSAGEAAVELVVPPPKQEERRWGRGERGPTEEEAGAKAPSTEAPSTEEPSAAEPAEPPASP